MSYAKAKARLGIPVGKDAKGREILTGHTVKFGKFNYFVNCAGALSANINRKRRAAVFPAGEWDPAKTRLVTDPAQRIYFSTEQKWLTNRLYADYDKVKASLPRLDFEETTTPSPEPSPNLPRWRGFDSADYVLEFAKNHNLADLEPDVQGLLGAAEDLAIILHAITDALVP